MKRIDFVSILKIALSITAVISAVIMLLFCILFEMNRIVTENARLTDILFVPLAAFVIFMLAGIAAILGEDHAR